MSQQLHVFGDEPLDKNQMESFAKTIKIKQIACGYYHIIILDELNNIYTCGRNANGQLGLGHKNKIQSFTKVNELNGQVKYIAGGGYFTLVVTLQNEILGAGRTFIIEESDHFTKIQQLQNVFFVKNIKCGGVTSIMLNNQDEFFVAGMNIYNQLGHPDVSKTFTKFEKLNLEFTNNGIKDIGCGYSYSIILTNDNFVYISGFNKFKTFTKFDTTKYKQISCLYEDFNLLTLDGKQLYNYKNVCNYNYNEDIKKVYSGLGNQTYYLTFNKEIKKATTSEVSELVKRDWQLPYLSVFIGNNFVAILNSTYCIDEEKTKEVKRMIDLLFKQVIDYSPFADIHFEVF